MQLILNGDTRPIIFFLASSTDHITGLPGATPNVTVSRNGGAFTAPAGAASEIGNGFYALTPAGADVTTNGMFLLHATATGADPCDVAAQVVAFSPYDGLRLGLGALPNAAVSATGGLPTVTDVKAALTTAQPESYAVEGASASLAQLAYMSWSLLSSIAQSNRTITAYKLDGATPAMTFALDDATAPASRIRAS